MAIISANNLLCKAFHPAFFTICNARYRCFKGGRATGKSQNIFGYEVIFKILSSKLCNIIMCRANDVDNADSTYANIVQCINELGIGHLFKCITSPYKITRKATGQVILFRGCNNPTSLTSIKPQVGYFSDVYFEEASELKSYEDFRKIDGSLRIGKKEIAMCEKNGETPRLQITFAFNAWDIGHWLYEKFFKGRLEDDEEKLERDGYIYYYDPNFNDGFGAGLALHISSYKANEFLPQEKIDSFALLKTMSYDLFKVEALGCWGNTTEGCYPCFSDDLVIDNLHMSDLSISDFAIGVDVGISDGQGRVLKQDGKVKSATTMALVALTQNKDKLVVIDEFFHTNIGLKVPKTEPQIQKMMCDKLKIWKERYPFLNLRSIRVVVDSASPSFMQTFNDNAKKNEIYNLTMLPSTKLKIHNRINFTNYLMAFKELLISSSCKNLIREFKQAHKGQKGEPRDGNDHIIDAYEYAATMLWGKMRRSRQYKWNDESENKKVLFE